MMLIETHSPIAGTMGILVHHLGLETFEKRFIPVLRAGTEVPCEITRKFSTTIDNQRTIEIAIYRGIGEFTAEATLLGCYKIDNLPESPAGVPEVLITFQVLTSGNILLGAVNGKTETELSIAPVEGNPDDNPRYKPVMLEVLEMILEQIHSLHRLSASSIELASYDVEIYTTQHKTKELDGLEREYLAHLRITNDANILKHIIDPGVRGFGIPINLILATYKRLLQLQPQKELLIEFADYLEIFGSEWEAKGKLIKQYIAQDNLIEALRISSYVDYFD
jgi:hypothetical protein